jgi:hypothetical protein
MLGKISRLPHEIRQRLNQRLSDGELGDSLLPWLNSLPEAQALLADHFEGQPISEQNLSDYRKRGFRHWEMRQDALEFATDDDADPSPSTQLAASPLVDRLVNWIATRFAAAAQNASIPEDPQADLREIRNYLTDIVALRRGDLVARRLGLEQQRLALGQAKSQQELEKLFWEWTKRPDIQAQLNPHRDPDKMRRDVVRMLDRQLLGIRDSSNGDPEPDPAVFI